MEDIDEEGTIIKLGKLCILQCQASIEKTNKRINIKYLFEVTMLYLLIIYPIA